MSAFDLMVLVIAGMALFCILGKAILFKVYEKEPDVVLELNDDEVDLIRELLHRRAVELADCYCEDDTWREAHEAVTRLREKLT